MKRKTKNNRRGKPPDQVKIARERINLLLDYAIKEKDEKLSKRYVYLAKRIGMRYNVKMPAGSKRSFCRYCFARLTTGWRTKRGVIYTTCESCRKTIRYPFRPKKA